MREVETVSVYVNNSCMCCGSSRKKMVVFLDFCDDSIFPWDISIYNASEDNRGRNSRRYIAWCKKCFHRIFGVLGSWKKPDKHKCCNCSSEIHLKPAVGFFFFGNFSEFGKHLEDESDYRFEYDYLDTQKYAFYCLDCYYNHEKIRDKIQIEIKKGRLSN
jgi:hypothetical protein